MGERAEDPVKDRAASSTDVVRWFSGPPVPVGADAVHHVSITAERRGRHRSPGLKSPVTELAPAFPRNETHHHPSSRETVLSCAQGGTPSLSPTPVRNAGVLGKRTKAVRASSQET